MNYTKIWFDSLHDQLYRIQFFYMNHGLIMSYKNGGFKEMILSFHAKIRRVKLWNIFPIFLTTINFRFIIITTYILIRACLNRFEILWRTSKLLTLKLWELNHFWFSSRSKERSYLLGGLSFKLHIRKQLREIKKFWISEWEILLSNYLIIWFLSSYI